MTVYVSSFFCLIFSSLCLSSVLQRLLAAWFEQLQLSYGLAETDLKVEESSRDYCQDADRRIVSRL